MLTRVLEHILGVSAADDMYARSSTATGGLTVYQNTSRELGCKFRINKADLEHIPKTGPVIIVANHPTGAVEGVGLPAAVERVRPDVKTLGHVWFQRWPRLADRMILVNPQGGKEAAGDNRKAMKEAVNWIRGGGVLVVFPAGAVSRFQPEARRVEDSAWQKGLAYLLRATGAPVVPVHVSGRNSLLYQILSAMNPRLGALLLAREMVNKRGKTMDARIGKLIPFRTLPSDPERMLAVCRQQVETLEELAEESLIPVCHVFLYCVLVLFQSLLGIREP